jgi:Ala-tRNA(Pro) deacylase
MDITQKIISILTENQIQFDEIDHGIAQTCEESARARGADIRIGGKTILFKDKRDFRLFTLSASLEVDSNRVRKILKSQRLRFATNEELQELCSVERGALPPLGKELYPFDHYLDKSIISNDKIAFNAGILTKSIIMSVEDYIRLTNPIICEFSK